ncbi:hypothetical protein [Sphingomonas sp. LHG3406-1]|uniref:hypothetical protein n=1 Tax=Sphingomonas sp. LHG3406-1 TaxID=2804617 RepID=UPI00262B6787|nr:hypothetical protein [Sphingomonas sp. LHG3406-1]
MSDRVTITLSELHCEAQSEPGGCEPYLFTSFYAIGADGNIEVKSPRHPDVREAFSNDIEAGTTLQVPQEIGTCELPAGGNVGFVALVIDEDMGRLVAVDKAHDAFHAAVEEQLRDSGGRIDTGEIISKVRSAVHGTFDYSDLHRDQDDLLGIVDHRISGSGPFEAHVGTSDDDRFILRGEVR